MATVYGRFSTVDTGNKETYFVGANSGNGFISEYDTILSEAHFERVYIIKGGPGVGKSTAIGKCAESARQIGAHVTEYRCSSDASSLDMAVMEKDGHRIAVLDGTAPHSRDPVYPGATGEIVDFGRAWDIGALHVSPKSSEM